MRIRTFVSTENKKAFFSVCLNGAEDPNRTGTSREEPRILRPIRSVSESHWNSLSYAELLTFLQSFYFS